MIAASPSYGDRKGQAVTGMICSIRRMPILALALFLGLHIGLAEAEQGALPLPSWNDGPARRAIVDFVSRVTRLGGPDYVSPSERIATFDNDGTLWVEQPLYFQAVFAIDQAREASAHDPRLASYPAYRKLEEHNRSKLAKLGEQGIGQLLAATHSGMTPEAFRTAAESWLDRAEHPRFARPYKELVYQPMIELLTYLRTNEFKTFIVSGGGVDFIRAFSAEVYGIPPEQVVGSSGMTQFVLKGERADLIKLPKLATLDDKDSKPININLHIGRRPILAFGNSDGDLAMLQYTASGPGARLMLLLHHDDAEREYAYDRQSKVGRLDKALDAGFARGWTVVSMKSDWNIVFRKSAKSKTSTERSDLRQ